MSDRERQLARSVIITAMIAWSSHAHAQQPIQAASPTVAPTEVGSAMDLSDTRLFSSAGEESFPANIHVPSAFDDWAHQIWLRSPTFRRQCARISSAGNVRVQVTVHGTKLADALARTQFQRDAGEMVARVELVFPSARLVELLAHELEHVIEQIDGIDLPRLARQGASGVSPLATNHFETARAVATGKKVAWEFNHAGQMQADAQAPAEASPWVTPSSGAARAAAGWDAHRP